MNTLSRFAVVVLPLALLVGSTLAQTTIVVNEPNDELVADGDCSLREAIIAANTDAAQDACPAGSDSGGGATDEIILPSGTIVVSFPGPKSEDAAASGDLDLLEGVRITGQGAGVTIIDGSGASNQGDGLFDIRSLNTRITGVTMESIAPSLGWNGAIYVQSGASLVLESSEILNGAAVSSSAGAIWINGTMEIHNSTISGNQSEFKAGGIYVNFASLSVYSSLISNNSAYDAGGIYSNNSAVTLVNTTVSGNTATSSGDGMLVTDFGNSDVDLSHVTFAGNDVVNDGTAAVGFSNTIVTGGVSGTVLSGGYNVIDSGSGFTGPGDQVGANPQLGALQDNGGPTLTHSIPWTSPARDTDGTCSVSTDQRGFLRGDDVCDSGAYEYAALLAVEFTRFDVVADQRTAVLSWQTATETNNMGFEVEHSRSDVDEWRQVSFVPGRGTTSTPTAYNSRAENLEPGRHRFRLRQVDFDGSFAYSSTVAVFIEVPDGHLVSSAFPNPFTSATTLSFSVERDQHITATLHDVTGRRLLTLYDGFVGSQERREVRVRAAGLASGAYFIRVTGEYFTASRVVVARP